MTRAHLPKTTTCFTTYSPRASVADYTRTLVDTSSVLVRTALAVMYADLDNPRCDVAFKRYAVRALQGLDDDLANVYHEILWNESDDDIVAAGRWTGDMSRAPIAEAALPTSAQRAAAIGELVSRGLLLAHNSSPWGGQGDNDFYWRYPAESRTMRDLLDRAAQLAQEQLEKP